MRGQLNGDHEPAEVTDAEANAATVLQRERADDLEAEAGPAPCGGMAEAASRIGDTKPRQAVCLFDKHVDLADWSGGPACVGQNVAQNPDNVAGTCQNHDRLRHEFNHPGIADPRARHSVHGEPIETGARTAPWPVENVIADRGDLPGRDSDCLQPLLKIFCRAGFGGAHQPLDGRRRLYQVMTQLAQRQMRRDRGHVLMYGPAAQAVSGHAYATPIPASLIPTPRSRPPASAARGFGGSPSATRSTGLRTFCLT